MVQKLIFTNLVGEAIDKLIDDLGNPSVFILSDVNTSQYVIPVLALQSKTIENAPLITIKAGDMNKTLDQVQNVWKRLQDLEAVRTSVLINIGGGMVTDLGGFVAATYKRGIRAINIPTNLLSAVDASIGGKTAINFNGYKNDIGTFTEPVASIISTIFFNTLPKQELLSGYAEMLKHALLESHSELRQLMDYSVQFPQFDPDHLLKLIESNVKVKTSVVEEDLTENGARRMLNLGHTAGHAFEELAFKRLTPIPHGFAVAHGCVVALILSHMILGLPSDILYTFSNYVRKTYNVFDFSCDDYDQLLAFMSHDKKVDKAGEIRFTLLANIGDPRINNVVSADKIRSALDIYRDMMGI